MKRWTYTSAASSRRGLMQCNCCGKAIEGEYRCREGRDGVITQHRECTTDDKEWVKRDALIETARTRAKERLEAYKTFRDHWDEMALDLAIEQLEKHIEYLG